MRLSRKQRDFTVALNSVIYYGFQLGYEFTLGDAFRANTCSHGHKKSTHRYRLAQDLNLFINDEYITSGEHPAWVILHDYFEALGGSAMIESDPNHFSFEHNGVR